MTLLILESLDRACKSLQVVTGQDFAFIGRRGEMKVEVKFNKLALKIKIM